MEFVPEDILLEWLALRGLESVSAWPGSYEIQFAGQEQQRAFWMLPNDPELFEPLILAVLSVIEPWESVWLVPRDRIWPARDDEWTKPQSPRAKLMNCFENREPLRGAIRCSRAERSAVVAFVFAHMLTAQLPEDDLYLVGDSADSVVYVDSEGALHVSTRADSRLDGIVRGMASMGFTLPDDVPCTFKWPESMARQYRKP